MSVLRHRPSDITISSVPVTGVGGLGLFAMAIIAAIALPPLRWTMLGTVSVGLVVGCALAWVRHR